MEAVLCTTIPHRLTSQLVSEWFGKSNMQWIEDVLTPGMFSILLTSYQSRFSYVSGSRAHQQPARFRQLETYGRPQSANLQSRG